jgi:hypothetical protein
MWISAYAFTVPTPLRHGALVRGQDGFTDKNSIVCGSLWSKVLGCREM